MGTMLFCRGAEGYNHHRIGSQYFLSLNPTKVFQQYALCLGTACALDRERKNYDQCKNGKHQLHYFILIKDAISAFPSRLNQYFKSAATDNSSRHPSFETPSSPGQSFGSQDHAASH